MLSWPPKDPAERLDYTLKWYQRLSEGDVLSASEWRTDSDSPGLVIDIDSFDGNSAVVWLKDGLPGKTYIVTNTVTTTESRIMEVSVKLKVKER